LPRTSLPSEIFSSSSDEYLITTIQIYIWITSSRPFTHVKSKKSMLSSNWFAAQINCTAFIIASLFIGFLLLARFLFQFIYVTISFSSE